jgi:hypothetical protein
MLTARAASVDSGATTTTTIAFVLIQFVLIVCRCVCVCVCVCDRCRHSEHDDVDRRGACRAAQTQTPQSKHGIRFVSLYKLTHVCVSSPVFVVRQDRAAKTRTQLLGGANCDGDCGRFFRSARVQTLTFKFVRIFAGSDRVESSSLFDAGASGRSMLLFV